MLPESCIRSGKVEQLENIIHDSSVINVTLRAGSSLFARTGIFLFEATKFLRTAPNRVIITVGG
jgi:hypothetical protein